MKDIEEQKKKTFNFIQELDALLRKHEAFIFSTPYQAGEFPNPDGTFNEEPIAVLKVKLKKGPFVKLNDFVGAGTLPERQDLLLFDQSNRGKDYYRCDYFENLEDQNVDNAV